MTDIPSWFVDWFSSNLGSGSPGTVGGAPADVSVGVTSSSVVSSVGQTIRLTVTATNVGAGEATDVALSTHVPRLFAAAGASVSAGRYDDATGFWAIGSIAAGATATLTITSTVQASGGAYATAEVNSESSLDAVTANNVAGAFVVAAPAGVGTPIASVSPDGGGLAAPTSGAYNVEIVTSQATGAVVQIAQGYQAAYLAGGAAATLVDSAVGNAVLGGGAGDCTILSGMAGDTLVAGAGNSFLVAFASPATMSASGQAGNTVFWGGGGAVSIQGGNGHDTAVMTGGGVIATGAGGSQVWLGTGNATVSSTGADTIVGGSGAETVNVLGTAGVLAFAGGSSGRMVFNGGAGASTVVGFGGSVTVNGGTGGGVFFGGTAGRNVIGTGGGDAVMFGGGDGDVLTATGTATVAMAASSGSETLDGAANAGSNAFFGGYGNDVMRGGSGTNAFTAGFGSMTLIGGGSSDLFVFLNGATSQTVIQGFNASRDYIKLNGFGDAAPASAFRAVTDTAAGAFLRLTDGTTITFAQVGKSALQSSNFT